MKRTFADTSFYIAVSNPNYALHADAIAVATDLRGEVVTSDFVLLEAGNYFARAGFRSLFLQLVATVRADTRTRILPAHRDLWDRGFTLYSQRPDKDWSMTDCTSFVIMQDEQLIDALTADHHFRQAGFTCLLPVAP